MNRIDELASLYGVSSTALRRCELQGNYNETFEFEWEGRSYMLRVSPDWHDVGSLQKIMRYLQEHSRLGSPVVEPKASLQGLLVETVIDPEAENRKRLVTVTAKAPGVTHELLEESSLSRGMYRRVGEATARIHNNAAAMGTAAWKFPVWYESDNCFNATEYPETLDPRIVAKYQLVKEHCREQTLDAIGLAVRAEENDLKTSTWGVIHGDLHFSNILIDNHSQRITFCDFDDACLGIYAMDVAMIVFDLKIILQCIDKQQVFERMVSEILAGYNAVCIGQPEALTLDDLESFLKLLEISMFLQCWSMYEEARTDGHDLTGWLGLFYAGREQRILADLPYLEFSCQ